MADRPYAPFNGEAPDAGTGFERRIQDLAPHVRFPATPDIATSMRTLLALDTQRQVSPPVRADRTVLSRLALAAVVLLAIVGGMLAISSSAREAVADWFDIPGIRILHGDPEPTPSNVQSEIRRLLGDERSTEELVTQSPFVVSAPAGAFPGAPDERYLLLESDVPTVSLIYLADDGLPAIAGSSVGLFIMQFEADQDSVWLEKQLGRDSTMAIVQLNGVEALWIEGTHILTILPQIAGTPTARTSANVLVWNSGGVTYRIEADLPRHLMLEIAESMQPITP